MINYERIKQMDIDEMAVQLFKLISPELYKQTLNNPELGKVHIELHKKWLECENELLNIEDVE